MSEPTILFGVGATKAGTTWLHSALKAHPACAFRDIKEAHYWDTVNVGDRLEYLTAREDALHRLRVQRHQAEADRKGWKAANLDRQIAAVSDQIDMLCADRRGNQAYLEWLQKDRADQAVVADFSPSYALLNKPALERMTRLTPHTKVIYLMRDPLSRLWSHVRMVASRNGAGAEKLPAAANRLLRRVIDRKSHQNIVNRGDYKGTVEKLVDVVPENRLLMMFSEETLTSAGFSAVCRFLGIKEQAADTETPVHSGAKAVMEPTLRADAMAFLKDQYDWARDTFGPLPQAWQNNLERVSA